MNKSLLVKQLANTKFSELSLDKLIKLKAVLEEPEVAINKQCPVCNNTRFAKFMSLRYKQCLECGTEFEWNLKEGQQSLIKYQR